jgi:hypothetical protein
VTFNLRLLVLAVGLLGAGLPAASRAAEGTDAALRRYVVEIGGQLDPRVADVLARIDGTGRQLLALRSYLRSGRNLAERWSWTQQQIAAYEGSPEQVELQQEIEHVRAAFGEVCPGFELWVNPQVRSLDVQIEHWNSNESVASAAEGLLAAARLLVDASAFPASSPARSHEALERWLAGFLPSPTPTVAAPGLSPHGQMRAIDFQVHQGDRVVAGPSTATIATDWEASGWAAKLDEAVRKASRKFVGPLASPKEPWHYTFTPESVAAQ